MKRLIKTNTLAISMMIGGFVAILISAFTSFAGECEEIPGEVLRLHIIANSDSDEDQSFKLKLRDHIFGEFSASLNDCSNLDEALKLSNKALPKIERSAKRFAKKNGYDKEINAEITEMYFPTRVYNGQSLDKSKSFHSGTTTLPAGEYLAIRLTIGEGEGKNWWCVMFPPLCTPAVTDETIDVINAPVLSEEKPKIRFAVFEFLSGVFNKR